MPVQWADAARRDLARAGEVRRDDAGEAAWVVVLGTQRQCEHVPVDAVRDQLRTRPVKRPMT
ncbi:hypothetical protein BHS05_12195 [Myxococcus xanthus]|uniref:Uncharacterized protein n=1 Tax=Myxococcus xanthus TaxID=34 RepID=A0AAE6FYQ6_MYXXA|nr:hypothetical protein BHS09_12245 [Myxococcus xanthus]QDE96541.1 hypothetical protein BHS05_12195 [Myxococcus xanthus]